MTDPFEGVPEPSESFQTDVLFPFFDDIARDYGLDDAMMLADLRRVLRPSVLISYSEWITESWEATVVEGVPGFTPPSEP